MKIKVPKGIPLPDQMHITYQDGGEILKQMRCEKYLTKREMAQRLGISYSYMVNLEDGDKHMPFDLFNRALQQLGFRLEIRRAE